MFPWGKSQDLMESSMHSARTASNNMPMSHLQRLASSCVNDDDDDDDNAPCSKRLRTSDFSDCRNGRNAVAANSLVAHLTHTAVSKEAPLNDFMGHQTSNMLPMWPAPPRRVSASSIPSPHHGPFRSEPQYLRDTFVDHVESRTELVSHNMIGEGDRYFEGIPHRFTTTSRSGFDVLHHGISHRRGSSFPRYPQSAVSSGLSMMTSNSRYNMESPHPSWMGPMHHARRHSFSMQPAIQSSFKPIQSFPISNFDFGGGDEELYFPSNSMPVTVTDRLDMGGPIIPKKLPVILALPEDRLKLSAHQVFLRYQIEAFKATEEDVTTHTRGRNKAIKLGQVGIRCRHCAHVAVAMRQKGSVYYPSTLLGLYQAAQNISATHLQCGLCTQTPLVIKQQFVALLSTRAFSSGAGRPYWAQSAKKLGLIDTAEGIRFAGDVPTEPTTEDERGTCGATTEVECTNSGPSS